MTDYLGAGMNDSTQHALPAALRTIMKEELLGSHQDGMKLGIKFGAKTLRDTADECAKDSTISPDYIRGLRDAAVFIERFAEVAATESLRG